ncbi:MAG TPA: glycosyl hydrolase family 28-related protein [Mycobacterium sp.]|nr:glycosyl hydrolase family 28-related protein [Mycobacterium sp.]
MPNRALAVLLCLTAMLSPVSPVFAQQNQPLFATGVLTPGHALVLQQAGTPGSAVTRDAGPAIAGNFTELGITNDGLPLCVRDKAQQHLLCFGANALGGGLISFNPVGSGTATPLNVNINGQMFPFPTGGSGPSAVSPLNAVLSFGADPTGSGDNSLQLGRIFAQTGGQTVYFPDGVYRVACGHTFPAASGVNLLGSGRGKAIIKFDPGCTPTGDFFSWTNFTSIIQNITIDLNTPATSSSVQYAGLAFYVNGTNNLLGPQIINSEVLHLGTSSAGAYNMRLSVLSNSASWTYPIVSQSQFTKTTADAATANECIAFSGSGNGDSTSLGLIHFASVTSNVCINSAIQADGDNGIWALNNVSGWAFGNGIFAIHKEGGGPLSDHDNLFVGNELHDSPAGYDVNSSAASCVENNGMRNTWVGNLLHDCGGEGFRNYGEYTTLQGGAIYNNGKTAVIVGNYQRAGINAVVSGLGAPFDSGNLTIDNVKVYDTAGTQSYGYADASGIAGPVNIKGALSGAVAPYNQLSAQGTLIGDIWQTTNLSQASGITCFTAGPPTAAVGNIKYQKQPFKVAYLASAFVTTNGTCADGLKLVLPFPSDPALNSFDYTGAGESATTSTAAIGLISHTDVTHILIRRYDSVYPATDNTAYAVMGEYPTIQ